MATATKTATKEAPTMARLKTQYNKSAAELMKELRLKNKHQLPRLQKIVVNVGLGRAKDDKKLIEVATNTLKKVTAQSPVETVAKKSIAGFKLREGNKIGLKVTLRGDRMYEFMDRFINIVLPRMRDFHGVSNKSFDASGNFAVGLTDQSVFPELTFEETTNPHGLQVIFVIDAHEPEHSRALLASFGMPFEKTIEKKTPEPAKAAPVAKAEPAVEVEKEEILSNEAEETK